MSDSLQPHGLYRPRNSPGRNTGVGSHSLLQGNLPNSGIKPRFPTLQADSLLSEPPGKPRAIYILFQFLSILSFFLSFLAGLGLHCRTWALCCCTRACSNCGQRGLLPSGSAQSLTVVAFLVAEHRLWGTRAQRCGA